MKIIIPVASLHMGGGCRILAETANGLHRRGHEVEVVIPAGKPIDYIMHCKVTRIPSLDAVHIPDGDVILPNYYTTVMPSFQAYPTKCIRLSLGFEPLWSNDKEGTMDTYMLPMPIWSISQGHYNQIISYTGRTSTILNPGIDHSVFHPPSTPKKFDGVKKILFLARDPNLNYEFKGVRDFATAMRIVQRKTKIPFQIQLLCPEGNHSLHGLPVQIFGRAGSDAEIANRYHDCDIFVSASWFESFGYPVLEAMACGALVVTTNSGGVRDFAIDGQTCMMAPPRDPDSLAKMILRALELSGKPLEDLKTRALMKAKEFTWDRYFTQLQHMLHNFRTNEPVVINPENLASRHIKNYEYGKLMAKMECIPHAIDLPGEVSLPEVIRLGAQQHLNDSHTLWTHSPQQIEQMIIQARTLKRGFSYISLGDTECAFLAINRQAAQPYIKLPEEGIRNAGYDPSREQIERQELLNAIRSANIVGIPHFRHGLIQRPLMHYLSANGVQLNQIQWGDSTAAYQLMNNGALQRILISGSPKVLCIGNEAQRLANYLVKQGVIVSGVLAPVRGFKDYQRIVDQTSRITYDIALVAAGAASIPICAKLSSTSQKIALDIGKVADEWITGITAFNGQKSYEHLLRCDLFSQHQKNLCLEVQSGYQQGLNELIPSDQRMPVQSLPHHWIRTYSRSAHKSLEAGRQIRNPIWLKQQLQEALLHTKPLSIVTLNYRKIVQLASPYYADNAQLQKALNQIDVLGVPYLNSSQLEPSRRQHYAISPRLGLVDATVLQQLQFDYFGRFLPEVLKNKRLLLVAKSPKMIAEFMTANGYSIWGTIDTAGGRVNVMKELSGARNYDIALVSAGVETFIYNQFIADRMGKIALDVGDMLHDASIGSMNVAMWMNQSIHKMD